MGNGHTLGEKGGTETVTITLQTMAQHQHFLNGSSAIGNAINPRPQNSSGTLFAQDPGNAYSANLQSPTPLNSGSVYNVGGSQPHTNMQPYLVLNFCIALQGIFPSQT